MTSYVTIALAREREPKNTWETMQVAVTKVTNVMLSQKDQNRLHLLDSLYRRLWNSLSREHNESFELFWTHLRYLQVEINAAMEKPTL